MLKSIGLGNYKCFTNETNIRIAPLTILCGTNSSGKSSILKSLLLLKQSYEDFAGDGCLTLNGKYTNNGSFREIANNTSESVTFHNTFEFRQSRYMSTKEKNALKDLGIVLLNNAKLTEATLSVDYTLKSMTKKSTVFRDNALENLQITITSGDTIDFSMRCQLLPGTNKYEITVEGLPNNPAVIKLKNVACYFDGLQLGNLFYDDVEPEMSTDGLLTCIYTVCRITAMQYKDIYYLSPLRSRPERRYIVDRDVEDVGIYGEYVPQILEKFKAISGKINAVPEDDTFSERYKSTGLKSVDAVNTWLNYLGVDPVSVDIISDCARVLVGKQNISDVGFGISQVLPIVVAAVTLPYKSTLWIEQPEIHLHPRMQMAVADLLIAASMAHKNVIIETHSEHMLNRISRRMMENPYILENTSINFVEKFDELGSCIAPIQVDPIMGIVTDNKNFFTEFADETEKLLLASANNRRKV